MLLALTSTLCISVMSTLPETLRTLHIRETNIDIVHVMQKMFTYFIGDYNSPTHIGDGKTGRVIGGTSKTEFLPEFNEMIDSYYDYDDKTLHYIPVDLKKHSLKEYVEAGKAARLAAKEQEEMMEMEEKSMMEELDEETKELRRQQAAGLVFVHEIRFLFLF